LAEDVLDRRPMCATGLSSDDALMPARPARTVAPFLVTAAAIIIIVSGPIAWPCAPVSGWKPPAAPAPGASPTTAASGLEPGLVAAFDAAAAAARQAGRNLIVTSGFRTVAEQDALLADAIAQYGPTEALRWVFPPDRSMHVRGLAVDVGDRRAAEWLDGHGARFGLCRTLAWEWWHFEWRGAWEASSTCPGPVDNPADAPT
jgi:zinc D-Ala-D-Ala carboxypeptidase